jgi:hypothetical protein
MDSDETLICRAKSAKPAKGMGKRKTSVELTEAFNVLKQLFLQSDDLRCFGEYCREPNQAPDPASTEHRFKTILSRKNLTWRR